MEFDGDVEKHTQGRDHCRCLRCSAMSLRLAITPMIRSGAGSRSVLKWASRPIWARNIAGFWPRVGRCISARGGEVTAAHLAASRAGGEARSVRETIVERKRKTREVERRQVEAHATDSRPTETRLSEARRRIEPARQANSSTRPKPWRIGGRRISIVRRIGRCRRPKFPKRRTSRDSNRPRCSHYRYRRKRHRRNRLRFRRSGFSRRFRSHPRHHRRRRRPLSKLRLCRSGFRPRLHSRAP